MVISLLFDKQPKFKVQNPTDPVSILISCKNEEKGIRDTLEYIARQDYDGEIEVIVIDNASTDETFRQVPVTCRILCPSGSFSLTNRAYRNNIDRVRCIVHDLFLKKGLNDGKS